MKELRLLTIPAVRVLIALALIAGAVLPLALHLTKPGLPEFFEGQLVVERWLDFNGHDVFVLKVPAEYTGWAANAEQMIEIWDTLIALAQPTENEWLYVFVYEEECCSGGPGFEYVATLDSEVYPDEYEPGATEEPNLSFYYGASYSAIVRAITDWERDYQIYAGYYGVYLDAPEWFANIPPFKPGDLDIVAWVMDWVYWLAFYSEQPWAEDLLYVSIPEGG